MVPLGATICLALRKLPPVPLEESCPGVKIRGQQTTDDAFIPLRTDVKGEIPDGLKQFFDLEMHGNKVRVISKIKL